MRGWPFLGAALFVSSVSLHARPPHLMGGWGGEHVGIAFEGGLANVRFDCASGTIDVPVSPAKDGSFEARGTYRAGTPGPVRVGQIYRSQPATYSGKVIKKEMTMSVSLEDGSIIGPFTLAEGALPQITRCL
jgi:hypothetical protein